MEQVRGARVHNPRASLGRSLLDAGLIAPGELQTLLARVGPPPAAGTRYGPYRLLEELGRGGMGAIHVAEHVETGARYALKTLRSDLAGDLDIWLRFGREAEALAKLDHPNVVRIHTAQLEGEPKYVVQDLYPGGDLSARLRAGPLPVGETVDLVCELAEGLAHAHARGVLHRDLKPENVLFDDQGHPRLCDFGLALLEGPERLTQTGQILGTPVYMAPEQAQGSTAVDERTDVYGLGALLYTCLTGEPPFPPGDSLMALLQAVCLEPPRPPSELRAEVPPALEAVCLRALAKRPGDRPSSALALRDALRASREAPSRRRRPGLLLPLAALGLLAVGGLALLGNDPVELRDRTGPRPGTPPPEAVMGPGSGEGGPADIVLPPFAWVAAAEAAKEAHDPAAFLAAVPDVPPAEPDALPAKARRLLGAAAILRAERQRAAALLPERGDGPELACQVAGVLTGLEATLDRWHAGLREPGSPGRRRSVRFQERLRVFEVLKAALATSETMLAVAPVEVRDLLAVRAQTTLARAVFELDIEYLRGDRGRQLELLRRALQLRGPLRGQRQLEAARACWFFRRAPTEEEPRQRRRSLARARKLAQEALVDPGPGPWRGAVQAALACIAIQERRLPPGDWPQPSSRSEELTLLEAQVRRRLGERVFDYGFGALGRLLDAGDSQPAAQLWLTMSAHGRAIGEYYQVIRIGPPVTPRLALEEALLRLAVLDPRGARAALARCPPENDAAAEHWKREHLLREIELLDGDPLVWGKAKRWCKVRIDLGSEAGQEHWALRAAFRACEGDARGALRDVSQAAGFLPRFPQLFWRTHRRTQEELAGAGPRRLLRDQLRQRGELSADATLGDW